MIIPNKHAEWPNSSKVDSWNQDFKLMFCFIFFWWSLSISYIYQPPPLKKTNEQTQKISDKKPPSSSIPPIHPTIFLLYWERNPIGKNLPTDEWFLFFCLALGLWERHQHILQVKLLLLRYLALRKSHSFNSQTPPEKVTRWPPKEERAVL